MTPHVVVTCTTEASYRALVDELMEGGPPGPAPLPVLKLAGPDSPVFRRLQDSGPVLTLQEWRAQHERDRDGQGRSRADKPAAADSVILCVGSEARSPARVLSLYTARPLLQADDAQAAAALLADAGLQSATVLVIGMPDSLSGRLLRDLTNRTPTAPTGVLAASGLDELSQHIAWLLLAQDRPPADRRHLLLFSDIRLAQSFHSGQVSAQFSSEFRFPEDVAAGQSELEFFALRGVGTSIHLEMGDDQLLCGKRRRPPEQLSPRFHSCQISTLCAQDPHNKRTRISVADIHTRVVFAQSCRGVSLGDSDQSLDLNLALGAISAGTLAYVSMIKRASGHERHLALASAGLRSGQTTGQLSQLLSQLHLNAFDEPPAFVLFGDPALRLYPEAQSHVPHEHEVDPATGMVSLRAFVQGTDFWCHRLPLSQLPDDYADAQIFINTVQVALVDGTADGTSSPVVDCYRNASELILVCGLPCTAPALDLLIELSVSDPLPPLVKGFARRLGSHISTLRTVAEGSLAAAGPQAEGRRRMKTDLERLLADVAPLRASIAAIVDSASRASYTTQEQRGRLAQRLEQCRQRLAGMEKAVLTQSAAWGVPQYFSALYDREHIVENERLTHGQCPTCQARLDIARSTSIFSPQVQREIWHCQRCLLVADRPAEGVEVLISGAMQATYGSTHPVTLHCRNPHDYPVHLSGTFRFYNSVGSGTLTENWTETLELRLSPASQRTLTVPLKLSDQALPGNHQIMLMYLHELGLGAAYTNLHLALPASRGDRRSLAAISIITP